MTALHWASARGHAAVVVALAQCGAPVDAQTAAVRPPAQRQIGFLC
jgi:hypothetical protein